jgi:hypothetical protein
MVQFDTSFSSSSIPTLPLLGLTEDEQRLIRTLQQRAMFVRAEMELCEAYYLGMQVIQNLRIAVPAELEFLRTIVGWPALAVDPYVERLQADCFRQTTATDGDEYLAAIMDANGFAAEQALAYTDALSMRMAYWMVGSPVERGDAPVVTVESPLNMSVLWDLRGLSARAAMQEYRSEDNSRRGALLVPGKTVHLATDDKGQWIVTGRDEHGFDFVPVIRMANRARTNNRDGYSEITPAIRSTTDAACRTLLSLEVARERYSVPQMILLGATEAAFQGTDGTPKAAWETYITKVLALERDDEGNVPEVKHATVYDPATFTKLLDWYASNMAGMVAATPQDLGLYTQGNPASAEAGVVAENRRDRRAVRMQNQFGVDLVKVAQMAVRFDNKGKLPTEYERLAVDWNPVTMQTPSVTADAVTKEIAAGSVPPTSDVVLKRLGYSSVERARLDQDRKREDGRQVAQALAASLTPGATTAEATDGNAADL